MCPVVVPEIVASCRRHCYTTDTKCPPVSQLDSFFIDVHISDFSQNQALSGLYSNTSWHRVKQILSFEQPDAANVLGFGIE